MKTRARHTRRPLILFALSTALLLPTAVHAAFTASIRASAPTEAESSVYVVTPYSNPTGVASRALSGERRIGQTFTATENLLLEELVTRLWSANDAAKNAEFKFELFEFSGLAPTGTALFSETATLPDSATLTSKGTWLSLTGINASLTAGKTYGFVFSWISSGPQIQFMGSNSTTFYTGGAFISADDASSAFSTAGDAKDITFALIGTSQIPEPSTWALIIGLSGLTLAIVRRIRSHRVS
ncbi:hypothetical protein OPIT5_19180 [Opitutaceae bacterium TAV5]|nr:hypothetical protein OPIT5_19180 [Opitutaceae bacterium TAV5]